MNNDSPNHVELVTPKTVKGGYKHLKRLVMLSYFLLPIIIFIVFASFDMGGLAMILAVVFVMLAYLTKLITWPYLDIVEYEYIIDKGVMSANFVRGKKLRVAQSGKRDLDRSITKKLAEVKLENFSLLAPYEGEYKEKADAVENKIICANMESSDLYCGIFKGKDGRESVIFFDAFNHCVKVLKYFNRDATVVKTMRY